MTNSASSEKTSYLFQIELLVEESGSARALEKLLHELNRCDFVDYRLLSGVRLGDEIDRRKEALPPETPIPVVEAEPLVSPVLETMRDYQKDKRLIRLIANRGLGVKLSIPCRIIHVDETSSLVTVYHVDEKQVYTFQLTEIEELIP